MRLKSSLFTACFFTTFLVGLGQDIIYKTDGSKLNGQVTEITPDEIKYKKAENPTGPTYVVSKENILLIEYKNGNIEYIAKDPKTVIPGKEEAPDNTVKNAVVKPKKPENDWLYFNKNTLLLNGAALANSDVTFLYDREFLSGRLSVTALAGYNFNLAATWPNRYIKELEKAKKNYDLGLGVNLYPFTGQRTQYFVGILFKYMDYSYDKEIPVYQVINGFTYQTGVEFQKTNSYQFSTLFINGIQIRISPTFNYKIFVGLGGFNARDELYEKLNSNSSAGGGNTNIRTFPKAYIGTCFGFRF